MTRTHAGVPPNTKSPQATHPARESIAGLIVQAAALQSRKLLPRKHVQDGHSSANSFGRIALRG